MDRLRTFGIVAHIDAGKTTLTERILFDTGAQGFLGSVDDGTAAMDWLPAEKSRGISITAAATRVQWGEHVLQIVDTPGHVDFVAEVERCLHVLDGVVVLVDGVRGVESQTEAVWEQAGSRGLPRLVFVNKLDRDGADFAAVVGELKQRLDCEPLPLVIPLHDGERRFAGLGDAVTGAVQWFDGRPDGDVAVRVGEQLRAAHERVVEAAADADDAVLADALANRRIAPERLRAALRPQLLSGRRTGVLAGAALWNRGVDWLLDAVVQWLPGLAELPRAGLWSVERAGDAGAPFCGLVFKVQHLDTAWNFVRVVRGVLAPGTRWTRARAPGRGDAVGELWHVRADRHEPAERATPGEIVVVPGELGLRTGDTMCDPDAVIALPAPHFPAPVLAVVFEPEHAGDGGALAKVLAQLAVDDPTLRVDADGDRLIVHGMGELHLDIVEELVRARAGVPFATSKPRVERRDAIVRDGRGTAEVRALIGGTERAARCTVAVSPADRALPALVVDAARTPGSAAAVEELGSRALAGARAGPLHGAVVVLEQASCDGEPCEPLLQQAAAKALANALDAAGVVALEPWVDVELLCPPDATAPVLADLGARGADVASMASGRLGARIEARAPLARMLGYVTRLRSMTKGRGQVSLRPTGFAEVDAG
jgi:elongation factor G